MSNTSLAVVGIAAAIALGVLSCWKAADDDVYPPTPSVTLGPWVGDLKVGPKMNAAGRDLRDSEFVHQNLAGAVFDRCDLTCVQFTQCNLSEASFKSARFENAGMVDCDLTGADFDNAVVNGLRTIEKHLSEKQLKSTRSYRTRDLSGCTVGGSGSGDSTIPSLKYDFRGVDLTNAHLLSADFRQCDFTDASIGGIQIARARITFAQIASTQNYRLLHSLRDVGITVFGSDSLPNGATAIEGKVDFRGVDLTGIGISGLALPVDADFTNATITGGNFCASGITRTQLYSTRNYKEGNLSHMEFRMMSVVGQHLDLSRQNLTKSAFVTTDCTGISLRDAVITDCNFESAIGLTLEQVKSTWNYKHGRMAGIVLPKELAEALRNEETPSKKNGKE